MATQSPRSASESKTPAPTEKRDRDRVRATGRVAARLTDGLHEGPSIDLSRQGLSFLTNEPPQIELTVDIRGERHRLKGRLVRLDSVGDDLVEWGIHLDEPLPGFDGF